MKASRVVISIVFLATVALTARADNSIPHTFVKGAVISASEMNANFNGVKQQIADLRAQVAALQAQVAALQANSALALDGIVSVGNDANGYKTVLFTGVNVQIVNGSGVTSGVPGDLTRPTQPNGLGNLIIGYNEPRTIGPSICSDGSYDNQADCETAGGVWAISHKSGSHNLVVGIENSYSQHGGVVFGWMNASVRDHSTITGGYDNLVRGQTSNISGGAHNTVTERGSAASISGGWANKASYSSAHVSGGSGNTATGLYSSVTGGWANTASGESATVIGGLSNVASGDYSSISGGDTNKASGFAGSISAGLAGVASGTRSNISGGTGNTASGADSSISGGRGCTEARNGGWSVGIASTIENDCVTGN